MNLKIGNKEYSSILFFISETLFLSVGLSDILNKSLNDAIISGIIGIILSFIFLYLILKFNDYEKDLNIFGKLDKLYGKLIGNIISIILVILSILYFIYLLWSQNIYVQNKYLEETSSIITTLFFLLPVLYLVKKDMKVISKVSIAVFFVTILELLFSYLNLFNKIDLNNYLPIFNTKISNILISSIKYASYSITPVIFLLVTPKNSINNPDKLNRNLYIINLISGIKFIIVVSFLIGIFGIDLSKLFYYPEYSLVKKINTLNFIQNVQNILTINSIYKLLISEVLSLFFIKTYFEYKNYNKIIFYIMIIISVLLSFNLFSNSTIGYNFIKDYYVFIYTIPILLLIIISNIKTKIKT
ncbi:MAG: GerAB/ArcD/ProY family transporter [Bacilli bacterium]|nr:GerAB/ArcD/ProY family transporter [Bacilli bacterium]